MQTHTIEVNSDTLIEDTEHLIVTLINPSTDHDVTDQTKALILIYDADKPGLFSNIMKIELYLIFSER